MRKSFKEAVSHIQGETLDVNVFLTATIDGQLVQRLFRVVGVWQVLEKEWHFYLTNLTLRNNPNFTPQFFQMLYALRWQIEIFFRDLKSVLRITNFVSESENGVKIQIYAALCYADFHPQSSSFKRHSSGRLLRAQITASGWQSVRDDT